MADTDNSDLLEARLNVLEKQVQFLLKINGLDISELRSATDKALLRIYQDVVHLLAVPSKRIPIETIDKWSELFIKLSEIEFIRIQKIVEYDHTWEPFYQLCVTMLTSIRQQEDFGIDLNLHHVYAVLERGRKNIRDAAVVMMKKYPNTVPARARLILKSDDVSLSLPK